ncbi:2OG-Fe(II) oxygenase [Sorangium sp. So ce296]|uniref:2OG-Fe(II) oxygenase n=1 Tax=Sorangium sp. So ce296 TaxID=3133296 RepID=UPI003F5FEC22
MQKVFANSQFAIYDDVLSSADFQRFWTMFQNTEFQPAHAKRMRDFYRVSDGNPFVGENIAWAPVAIEPMLPPGITVESLPVRFYPTKTALDALLDALQKLLPTCTDLIGSKGHDWMGIVGKLYAYPAGSSMSWHSDDDELDGSFIFYANPVWDVQWGGELFVADESTRNQLVRESMHNFGSKQDTEVLLRKGFGHYIMPKPNRLVVVGPGNPHKVGKVSSGAGDHVRASFSGFFIAPAGLEKLIMAERARRPRGERQ